MRAIQEEPLQVLEEIIVGHESDSDSEDEPHVDDSNDISTYLSGDFVDSSETASEELDNIYHQLNSFHSSLSCENLPEIVPHDCIFPIPSLINIFHHLTLAHDFLRQIEMSSASEPLEPSLSTVDPFPDISRGGASHASFQPRAENFLSELSKLPEKLKETFRFSFNFPRNVQTLTGTRLKQLARVIEAVLLEICESFSPGNPVYALQLAARRNSDFSELFRNVILSNEQIGHVQIQELLSSVKVDRCLFSFR